jgi:hypothetical protein
LQVLKEHFDTNNMAVSTVLPNDWKNLQNSDFESKIYKTL